MTNEKINAAIAEACGWRKEDGVYMWTANGIDWTSPELRDYCNDLNAMHEAEKVLKGYEQIVDYVWNLENRSGDWSTDKHMMGTHATARQRAEAFLRTLGKWEEAK